MIAAALSAGRRAETNKTNSSFLPAYYLPSFPCEYHRRARPQRQPQPSASSAALTAAAASAPAWSAPSMKPGQRALASVPAQCSRPTGAVSAAPTDVDAPGGKIPA